MQNNKNNLNTDKAERNKRAVASGNAVITQRG